MLTEATGKLPARNMDVLLWCCLSSVALLMLGGWLTFLGIGPWYDQLNFPPFQPPSWVFTPVWLVVLTLLALATWRLASSSERKKSLGFALVLYGAQFVLNVGWSLLFFTLKRPDAALWEIFVLDAVLILMIVAYGRVSKTAAWLLLPYLIWLGFATAINWWIVSNNHPFA